MQIRREAIALVAGLPGRRPAGRRTYYSEMPARALELMGVEEAEG